MSDVRVTEPHHTTPEDARQKVNGFEEMMRKYGVRADWTGSKAELKGTGVSGSINIDATHCHVHVKLGMMARAMGVDPVKLEGSIRKRLKAAFEGRLVLQDSAEEPATALLARLAGSMPEAVRNRRGRTRKSAS